MLLSLCPQTLMGTLVTLSNPTISRLPSSSRRLPGLDFTLSSYSIFNILPALYFTADNLGSEVTDEVEAIGRQLLHFYSLASTVNSIISSQSSFSLIVTALTLPITPFSWIFSPPDLHDTNCTTLVSLLPHWFFLAGFFIVSISLNLLTLGGPGHNPLFCLLHLYSLPRWSYPVRSWLYILPLDIWSWLLNLSF